MKLIAIYSVFDGLELLDGSIHQIFGDCFKVVLFYQTVSNYGEYDGSVKKTVDKLSYKYSNVLPVEFTPKLNLSGSQNEKNKRNLGIEIARELGASHFIFIDCDEYYVTAQFRRAKEIIIRHRYDSTACRLFTYFKKPTYQLTPLEKYYVPFIHSVKLSLNVGYPVYVDPTRGTPGENFYEFTQHELMMHHFSWVREDIGKKLRNSSAKINWEQKIPEMIKHYSEFKFAQPMPYYPGFSLIQVENQFGITY